MILKSTLLLSGALCLAGCAPECVPIRLAYAGTLGADAGPVMVAFRYGTRHFVWQFATVREAASAWAGNTCASEGTRTFGRSELNDGATMTAWIDVNRNASVQCDTSSGELSASCAPDVGEPSGSLPAPPVPEYVTLEIRDP